VASGSSRGRRSRDGGRAEPDAILARRPKAPQEAPATGADVLPLCGIGPELAAVACSMARVGWKADLVGSWIFLTDAFIEGAGGTPRRFRIDRAVRGVEDASDG
jgi:hypothetical protein